MKTAKLVLVRPDPKRANANRPADMQLAQEAAADRPCWVVLVGKGRENRLEAAKRALNAEGIAKDGLNVYAPHEVCGDDWTEADEADLPNRLAHYLSETGFRLPIRQSFPVEVRLPLDIPPLLLAAVVEAAAVRAEVDIRLGDEILRSSIRWEIRRDHFSGPRSGSRDKDLTGASASLNRVRKQVERYAALRYPVLVLGETGTGKDVIANMLHEQSGRQGNIKAVNAAQLPSQLADSLLFGHKKGSFTGADSDRHGRVREANGGTFFLDEVFNLEASVQGKLLRALNRVDEGIIEVEPVGSTQVEAVHTRLVVAALADPRDEPGMVGGSSMRQDLYYRVAAGVISLPPLRECLDDLPALCAKFIGGLKKGVTVEDDGIAVLREHSWPGNVRELRLVLIRAIFDGPAAATTLTADALRSALQATATRSSGVRLLFPCNLRKELAQIEVETMRAALRAVDGNCAAAGRKIGLGKNARNFPRALEKAEARLRSLEGGS